MSLVLSQLTTVQLESSFTIDSAINGDIADALFRVGQLPSLFGLFVTAIVLLVLVYIQGIHVDIPIVSTKYRGFTAVYPIKLVYFKHSCYPGIGFTCKRDFHGSDVVGKL